MPALEPVALASTSVALRPLSFTSVCSWTSHWAASVAAATASVYAVEAGSAVMATFVADGLLGIAAGSKYWHDVWFQPAGYAMVEVAPPIVRSQLASSGMTGGSVGAA